MSRLFHDVGPFMTALREAWEKCPGLPQNSLCLVDGEEDPESIISIKWELENETYFNPYRKQNEPRYVVDICLYHEDECDEDEDPLAYYVFDNAKGDLRRVSAQKWIAFVNEKT